MPNRLYPATRQKFLTGQLNWLAMVPRAIFLPRSYAPDFGNEFLADIPTQPRIAVSEPSGNLTANGGVASCDPFRFPLLVEGRTVGQAILYDDTGDEATSTLIAHIAEDGLVSKPFVPIGFNYYIYPDGSIGGYFSL